MSTGLANEICILKILQEYSDDQHILSTKEIIKELEAKYYLQLDRRSIYAAVSRLKELEYDISTYHENKKG